MEVEQDDLGRDLLEHFVGFAERVVVGAHEDASLEIHDSVGNARRGRAFVPAPAGHFGRKVSRAENAAGGAVRVASSHFEVIEDFAFVPDVVACGDDVDAEVEEFLS